MENRPLVSVLICAYNAAPYLHDSITAVINQTYPNLEIIVVEDGSTDNTLSVLEELAQKDKRIKIVRNERNLGKIHSLNKGLEYVSGKYIAFTDADDIAMSEWIEKIVSSLEVNHDVVAMGAYLKVFSEEHNGSKLTHSFKHNEIIKHSLTSEQIAIEILYGMPFCNPTTIIRSELIHQHHLSFNPDYKYVEDYKFWVDVSQYGKLANYPDALVNYRLHANQMSSQYNVAQRQGTYRILKEVRLAYMSGLGINTAYFNELSYRNLDTAMQQIAHLNLTDEQKKLVYSFLYDFYLSLDKKSCSLKNLWHFIGSSQTRYFTRKQKIKIIKKFIRPNKYRLFEK